MFISPAFAQGATGAASGSSFLIQLIPFVAIIAIMYLLIIRPQQQRMKAHQAMIAAVKRGDVVVTSGGIIGKVVKVLDNDEVEVEIAKEVRIKVVKSTIADIRSKTEPSDAKPAND
jgi:preprotein translocase subunit YajC